MSNIDAKKRAVREIKAINERLNEIEELHNDSKMENTYYLDAKKNLEEAKEKYEKELSEKGKKERVKKGKKQEKEVEKNVEKEATELGKLCCISIKIRQ